MEPKEKTRGYVLTSAGTLIIVLAVLFFGLTTDSGEIDWVSVMPAAAGFVMAGTVCTSCSVPGDPEPRRDEKMDCVEDRTLGQCS